MIVRPRSILLLALVHSAVGLGHAAVHALVNVIPGPADAAFIVLVIFLGPPVGAFAFARRSSVPGAWIFGGCMAATFAYGLLSHFVRPSPDNVAVVGFGGWGAVFLATSAALGLLEAMGVIAFLVLLGGLSRTPSESPGPSP